MDKLIKNYKVSCEMAKERIGELLVQRRYLRDKGDIKAIKEIYTNEIVKVDLSKYKH